MSNENYRDTQGHSQELREGKCEKSGGMRCNCSTGRRELDSSVVRRNGRRGVVVMEGNLIWVTEEGRI